MQVDLSEAGRALLDAITEGTVEVPTKRRRRRKKTTRRAWSMVATLEARGHAAETLAGLEAAELVERWDRPDGLAVTLTPWGKYVRDVVLLERPRIVREEQTDRDDKGKRITVRVEREDIELYWGTEDPSRPRPVRLPYRRREFSMPHPELKPDPTPGPEYMLNDEGSPVELFKGLFNGQNVEGIKVEVDNRLGGARTKKGKAATKAKAKKRKAG
jgi:hypothetical protein